MTDRPAYSLPERFYEEANRWLDRREAGEPGLEEKLGAWLNADPRHRQAFRESAAMLIESDLMTRGAAGFDGKIDKAPLLQRRSTHVALGVAAAIAVAGFATVWLAGQRLMPELASPAQAATYETALGEIRTFRLIDSSAVTLDTDTRIAVTLSGAKKHIELVRGRIRVDNASGFGTYVVTAGQASATLSGTQFDARLEAGALQISAPQKTLELAAAQPDTEAPREIAAGSTLSIGSSAGPRPVSRADLEWVSGMLALDGSPLNEAVAAVNRYNRIKIRLAGPDLASRKVTGGFRANDADGFAEAVARMFDLRIDRSKPGEILLLQR